MKTIAICDDNTQELQQASSVIELYAKKAGYDIQTMQYANVEQCVDDIALVDVVFMDIEFYGAQLGIKAAATINEIKPACQIVFLTNYLQYSLDVYGVNHAWFVLKEQLELRLPEIFCKLAEIDALAHAILVANPLDDDGLLSISCNDIMYLERNNRITKIALRDGESVMVRERVPELLKKMPAVNFACCHSSYAVNLNYVKKIAPSDLTLGNGMSLPISRRYSKPFRERYLFWLESITV